MVRQGQLIALVVAFLIGCAVLLLGVGCSGTSSETSGKEQTRLPEATTSEEEARCEGTRTYHLYRVVYWNGPGPLRTGSEEDMKKADNGKGKTQDFGLYTTNDLPGCPKGGLLLGTNGKDKLYGGEGDDEIRGLGAKDAIVGGDGNDVIYAGPGNEYFLSDGKGDDVIYGGDGDDEELGESQGDDVIYGGDGDDYLCCGSGGGKDVLYGGDGNDVIEVTTLSGWDDGQPDKFYCGKGKDRYGVNENLQMPKNDYVDSSCEKKVKIQVVV